MAGSSTIKNLITDTLRNMVIEMSFEKVTVSQLCKRANISRKTFYTYFEDKYAVLDAIIYDDIAAPCERLLPLFASSNAFPTGPTSSLMLNEKMLQSILEHRDFYISVASKGGGRTFARSLQKSSMRLHRTLAEMFGGTFDDKMRYACRFGAGAQAAVVIEWLRDDARISTYELATWMHEWCFNCSCVGFDHRSIDLPEQAGDKSPLRP